MGIDTRTEAGIADLWAQPSNRVTVQQMDAMEAQCAWHVVLTHGQPTNDI